MSTKDFARNNEVSGFSIPETEKKEEKAATNCQILTIKISNIDEQAIRAKLEQGINKNQQHIFRNKEGHLLDYLTFSGIASTGVMRKIICGNQWVNF